MNIVESLKQDISESLKSFPETDPDLTHEERELIRHSLPTGQFIVFDSGYFGVHIATEDRQWYSSTHRKYQELMVNAFRDLCRRGYIHHLRLCVFELTRPGFTVACQLMDKRTVKRRKPGLILV